MRNSYRFKATALLDRYTARWIYTTSINIGQGGKAQFYLRLKATTRCWVEYDTDKLYV